MKKYKLIKVTIVFLIIICLVGCVSKSEVNNIISEELINTGFPEEIDVTLFYKQYKDIMGQQKTEAYKLNDKHISETNFKYQQGCYNIFPQKALTFVSNYLGYQSKEKLVEEFGQPFIYKKYEKAEIFLFEGVIVGKNIFTVFLNINGKIETVKIEHPIGDVAVGICRDKNNLYVVSSSEDQTEIVLYKIETDNYSLKKYTIPVSNFGLDRVILYTDSNLVLNNVLYVIPKTMDGYTSNILMYDIETNSYKIVNNEKGISSNIFDIGDKLLVLNRGYTKDSLYKNSLFIDYYDYNLDYLSSESIPFEKMNHTEFKMRNFCYYYNRKIMGSINIIDNSNKNYIFIYDIDKKQIIYLSMLTQNDEKLLLNDDLFMYKKNNDRYHIF